MILLQRAHGLAEMGHLPEGYAEVEHAESGHGPTDPAGVDRHLQALRAGLVRRVNQKEIIAPIAQAERVRPPRQERQHEADFEAQDNVEDD